MHSHTLATAILVLLCVAFAPVTGAFADSSALVLHAPRKTPVVGDVIDATNLQDYGDLGSPSLRWLVEHGVSLNVGSYRKVALPRPIREATEKYSSKVRLSADGRSLIDHVAGLPFPKLDTSDPQIAAQLVFNFESAVARDDLDIRNLECRAGTLGSGTSPVHVTRTFLVRDFRRLYYRERTSVSPIPAAKTNPDAVRYKEGILPIIEPFDLKGTAFFRNRYIDPQLADDSWWYLPRMRRVRRVPPGVPPEPLFGQDIDQNSFAAFAGKASLFDWKYLGEKTILATFHDVTTPVTWSPAPGDYVHAGTWEPRKVWIVEGSPVGRPEYPKRILYIDQESFLVPQSELYNYSGELTKVWISSFLFTELVGGDTAERQAHGMPISPSVTMVDLLRQTATSCELPSRRFPSEQGWYVNVGGLEGTVTGAFHVPMIGRWGSTGGESSFPGR